MKKLVLFSFAAASLVLSSCGSLATAALSSMTGQGTQQTTTQTTTAADGSQTTTTTTSGTGILGGIIAAATNGQTVGNVLQSVLGLDKLTQQNLVGTWRYASPGCAFTSEQLLAQAGGEVVATEIKEKLLPIYQGVGITSANTQVTFNSDGTFSATIAGKSFSGKYTFDESTYKITLSGLLLNANCYAKKNSNGIALLFESSKLLTVLQTLSALSGNQSLQTIGDLSKNYSGVRLGFDMQK